MVRKKLYSAVFVSLAFALMTASVSFANTSKGTVTASSLNLRTEAGTYAEIVDRLYRGTEVTVNDSSNGWYNVTYGNLTGWVSGDYLEVSDSDEVADTAVSSVTGTVIGNSVNVRSGPSTSDAIINSLYWGASVKIVSRSDEWYNVQLTDGTTGWIFSKYVSTEEVASRNTSSTAGDILAYANKFLGVGYVYGGSTQYGFDCSGFTKYVFGNFGITLNRIAADQANGGVWIDKSRLSAGDLVFFATSGGTYISHAGIYIGDGNFIHSSSGAGKVTISNLWSGYYANTYITARRMIR
jgi:N-acetylmuramoyl-L-alanine amidase